MATGYMYTKFQEIRMTNKQTNRQTNNYCTWHLYRGLTNQELVYVYSMNM